MSVINTNYLALVSQNNLTKAQNSLGTAIERLSSGLRINSAKDDAAGQAIANRFTANIKGLTQASRNANDGISIAQTTEGSLNEINNNLQRIRELSVQAANGSNSQSDLNSIQAEIDQRLEEIDRVSRESEFNGRTILGENATGLTVQVGANDNQTISIGLRTINRDSLGLSGFNVNDAGVTPNKAATLANVQAAAGVSEIVAGKHYQLSETNTAVTAADVFGTASGVVSVGGAATTAGLGNALGWGAAGEVGLTDIVGDGQGNYTYSASKVADATVATKITAAAGEHVLATYTVGAGQSQDIKINDGGNITDRNGNQLYLTATNELSLNSADPGTVAATATKLAAAVSDASATLSVAGGPTYTGNGTNDDIVVTGATTDAATLGGIATGNGTWSFTVGSNVDGIFASVEVSGGAVTVGGTALNKDNDGNYTLATATVTDLYVHDNGKVTGSNGDQYFVDGSNALTTDSETEGPRTTNPLDALDKALANVDSLRSELGAVQNRFQSTIANLANTVNNLSAARSRIEDADYAVEVSNMTRAQILQQAGTSVLAQANQVPQTVLSLLR